MHSLDALIHCPQTGFVSSHLSFRCRQVRLQYVSEKVNLQHRFTYHPVRERISVVSGPRGSMRLRCSRVLESRVVGMEDCPHESADLGHRYNNIVEGDTAVFAESWMRGLAWFAPAPVHRHNLSRACRKWRKAFPCSRCVSMNRIRDARSGVV